MTSSGLSASICLSRRRCYVAPFAVAAGAEAVEPTRGREQSELPHDFSRREKVAGASRRMRGASRRLAKARRGGQIAESLAEVTEARRSAIWEADASSALARAGPADVLAEPTERLSNSSS